jgi:post-segregation antitoxin (ccd killing protein)
MFTGVPTTFPAFGFDAGWDRFETFSPVKDLPAHEPITRATHWIERELSETPHGVRRLVLIHTRGAHPPWDLSREEVALLKPEEYGGVIDARRGAIVLAGLRARHGRADRRLTDDDWTRLRALSDAAMLKQNAALAELIALLKREGAWDDTLFVYMGDVPTGDAPDIPFDPAAGLEEDHLLAPLLVKFPNGKFAGTEVTAPATTLDVAQTIVAAFRIKAPEWVLGLDLHELAAGNEPVNGRALQATLGAAFATRSGRYLLHGKLGSVPQLCQLDIDPSCAADVLAQRALAAAATWRWSFESEALARAARLTEREAASIDPDTAAALTVWGDIP